MARPSHGFLATLAVFLLAPAYGLADAGDGAGSARLELSGFLDLQWEPGADGRDRKVHRIGQAELDFDAEVAEGVGVCLAPAWDPVAEALGLGTAVVNYQLTGAGLENFCRERHLGRAGILAGRFDVPFGIDWLLYPSLDRPLVTMPLPVAATHGGWNADGLLLYGSAGLFNGVVHATSGFDHSRVLDSGGEAIWTGRHAYGGRGGAVPWDGLAVGASAAAIDAVEDGRSQWLLGLDLVAERGRWLVRGEFLRLRFAGEENHADKGWYLAVQRDFGAWYGIVRWDEWQPDGLERDRRVSLGTGVPVRQAFILRAEYEWWPDAGRTDRLVLQIAAGFGPCRVAGTGGR